ncbi:MAG: nitroreductase family deazaflavin-dependent oxidoreductase [Dehalococcoidia bacterium]
MTSDANDRNRRVIEEFRANDGRVGGPFQGATLLLLHTTGARSGAERVNPLMYQPLEGGSWAVFASKGGAPDHPDWYRNVRAHPEVTIEVGTTTLEVAARVAEGEERDRIWSTQKQTRPQFADYEARTDREIPVIVLERR